jgi:hypothetical protein
MTFNQARSLFAMENRWNYPPNGLPLMPIHPMDWFATVSSVPAGKLVADANKVGNGKDKKAAQKILPLK